MRTAFPSPLGTLLLALLSVAGVACGPDPAPRTLPVDLFRQLEGAPSIVLDVADPELAQGASGARERLVEEGWSVVLASDGGSTEACPRIRVGAFDAAWVEALAARVGWTTTERHLDLAGRRYRLKDTLLVLTLPDPERPGLPLTAVLAQSPAVQAFGLARVRPGWRPSLSLWWAGDPALEMPLDPAGRPRLDRAREIVPARKVEGRHYREIEDAAAHLSVRVGPRAPMDRAREVAVELARTRARVNAWAPEAPARTSSTRVVLESSLDRWTGYPIDHELAYGEAWPARVLGLVEEGLPDDIAAAGARLWLEGAFGSPAQRWVEEGAAYERADRYWGRELEDWAAHLWTAGLFPGAEALVDPERARDLSVHQRAPGRAMLVRYLLSRPEPADIAGLWNGGAQLELDAQRISGFEAYLAQRFESSDRTRPADPSRRAVARMRGAAFTQSFDGARRGVDGWGTQTAAHSLEQLALHGANAITLPCFFAEGFDGGSGWALPRARRRGGLDGDAAIALAVAQARQRGLRVVLVPEVLSNPSGTWRGDLKFLQPEAWGAFFEDYRRALVHFSLLAELLRVDVLSVGAGMPNATRTDGEVEEGSLAARVVAVKRDGWRDVVSAARAAYGGVLTYCASWPAQAPGIEFWGELDSVGATVFPELELPADPEVDPSVLRQLTSQIRGVRNLADDHGKPALILEVGFRSTERARSGEMDAGGATDQALQAELLEALAQGLAGLQGVDRAPHGLFLWEWPSSTAGVGVDEHGYSPARKAGEASLRGLFQ